MHLLLFYHFRLVLKALKCEYAVLDSTFKFHIVAGHFPFFPGKVLDKLYHLILLVRNLSKLAYLFYEL